MFNLVSFSFKVNFWRGLDLSCENVLTFVNVIFLTEITVFTFSHYISMLMFSCTNNLFKLQQVKLFIMFHKLSWNQLVYKHYFPVHPVEFFILRVFFDEIHKMNHSVCCFVIEIRFWFPLTIVWSIFSIFVGLSCCIDR